MELLFIGDVMLGRLVNEALKTRPPEYPWGDTLPLIRETDARICNLECVLTDGGSPARKAFTFRSDARNVEVLKAAGIDAVALANNHSLDYGSEALADTLGVLDQEGILHAGAGRDLSQAQEPASLRLGVEKVGLLAATDTSEPGWGAQEGKSGVWLVPIDAHDARAQELFGIVSRSKKDADILIVSLHWGSNRGYEPEKGHRAFAHALVEAGADIIFGHSAHVARGVELHKRKLIIYGAGDFVDDYAVDEIERNDESFIFAVDACKGSIERVRMYPTIIAVCQARFAGARRAASMAARMEKLCMKLGTPAEWVGAEGALEIRI